MMAKTTTGLYRALLVMLTLGLTAPAFGVFNLITEFTDDNVVNGNCTLREAIRASNINATVDQCKAGSANIRDTIFLPAGTYTLDLTNGTSENNALDGDLDITGELRIRGVSAEYTTVTGMSGQINERVFDIVNNAEVTFEDFTIAGGRQTSANGGNIRILIGSLDATEMVIRDGQARDGGGISNTGALVLNRSIVRDNQTIGNAGIGGGIENAGPLTLLDSKIIGNEANVNGGGLTHFNGMLTMYRTEVSGNIAGADGGGLFIDGDCDVQYSLLDANQSTRGGGYFVNAPQCEVLQSAVLNNTASSAGGGVYAVQDTIARRVTIAGNSAPQGGGIFSNTGMLLLDTATVARNLGGGGVFNLQGFIVEVVLMAENAGGNCLGTAPSAGAYNLDDANTCGFINNPQNDQPNFPNTDPLLGALGDFGGPTPTIELLPGSPAINAVSSLIQMGCQNVPDQRGRPRGRPRTALPEEEFHCDIGAFEFVTPYLVNSTLDENDADLTDDVCATSNSTCTLRAAIQQANASFGLEEIVLPAGTFALSIAGADDDTAATGDLDITDPLLIRGAGETDSIVDGAALDRVFDLFKIPNGASPIPRPLRNDFENLTVTGGSAAGQDGGGIRSSLPLRVSRAIVSGNAATAPDGDGGGIFCHNDCWLEIYDSVIADNQSSSNGGGLLQTSVGTTVIERSAVVGNTAGLGGGGESNRLRLRNSTVSSNNSGSSGGFFAGQAIIEDSTVVNNAASSDTGALFLLDLSVIRNSILALNTEQGVPNNCPLGANSAGIMSLGYNLSDTSSADCSLDQPTDLPNSTQPMIGPLQDNGGATFTHALLPGSLAVDRGDNERCPATDQRGMPRPLDGDDDSTANCDIGAYELGDADSDGVFDSADNCLLVNNPNQLDTDDDGFGNICDGDFNNDCAVNVVDLGILRANFFATGNNVTDMNGDGVTNVVDLGLLRTVFFSPPGPSGTINVCSDI